MTSFGGGSKYLISEYIDGLLPCCMDGVVAFDGRLKMWEDQPFPNITISLV